MWTDSCRSSRSWAPSEGDTAHKASYVQNQNPRYTIEPQGAAYTNRGGDGESLNQTQVRLGVCTDHFGYPDVISIL